ncbi:MAG TPA: ribosome biogenesis factor YjgA [Steroidobacteraceae bacterium]|jgi:ribosome-associated protein
MISEKDCNSAPARIDGSENFLRTRTRSSGPPEPEATDTEPQWLSRSARKRQAEALQRLGVELSRLTAAQLLQLPMPQELHSALLEAQRLRSRAALARQRQYIGRLMRTVDAEPLERALAAFRRSGGAKMPR